MSVFDGNVFDLGVFDADSAAPGPDPDAHPGPLGGVGRVRRRDVDRILRALRKKKKKPTLKVMAKAVLREQAAPETTLANIEALTEPLLTLTGSWKADAEKALADERAMIERAYAYTLAAREAEQEDDEEVLIAAWMAERQMLADVLMRMRFRVER